MAEIITATIPQRRKIDSRIARIFKLYQDAEAKLKKAEQQCNALHIPSLNELRYAGHHLLNGLNATIPADIEYEFHEAESHCKRAMFDAVEIRLMDHLQRIKAFEEDYKSIEIPKIIPDYLILRGKYLSVKTTLKTIEHTCREEYLEQCEVHLVDLETFNSAIDVAQPELQKAVVKERTDSRRALINIAIGLFMLVAAIVGIAVAYYHK